MAPSRIAFLGSSSTDAETYVLLVVQALVDAGKAAPLCINAGVGGDTAADMLVRVERDVLSRRPERVFVHSGMNDALRGVPLDKFESDLAAIVRRLIEGGTTVTLMTTNVLGPALGAAAQAAGRCSEVVRRVAERAELPLADVRARQLEAISADRAITLLDHVHPSFEGHRLIARAVLDALGQFDLGVPRVARHAPMPGLVRQWRVRARRADETEIDPRAVLRSLDHDTAWTPYHLPEANPWPSDYFYQEQERQRGAALRLSQYIGPGPHGYLGVATVKSDAAKPACLNTGHALRAVWLNGARVFRLERPHGSHLGKERLAVQLQRGDNTILIECGESFFVSITDDADW